MTTVSTPLSTPGQVSARATHIYKRHDELVATAEAKGPRDGHPISDILELMISESTASAPYQRGNGARYAAGARRILEWLCTHPGEGWQDRWVASGADSGIGWLADLAGGSGGRSSKARRHELSMGLTSLLLYRVVRPSYQFLVSYISPGLYPQVQRTLRPDMFAALEAHGRRLGGSNHRLNLALVVISKVVLHTGRDVDQLSAEDLLVFRSWSMLHAGSTKSVTGISLAWLLLREVTDLGEHLTLRDAVRYGQRPTAELVRAYRIQCETVRDVLIRYLDERRASLDYRSFTILVGNLAGRFWSDLEQHHPGIDSLHLSDEVAEAWKQRMRTVIAPDGRPRPRRGHLALLICIRSFYRDLQEWALQDPSWAPWSVPCPVRKADTAGQMKAKKKTTAEMHQRVRERLPHLPLLVDAAERRKAEQATLFAAVQQTPIGETVEHHGRQYRRTIPKVYKRATHRDSTPPAQLEDLRTGEVIDVGRSEHEAFWSWAVIETLRHTGIRVEELVEITHLALVAYQLPDTGEKVPMLQILPSKANEERLLLVSPELASVLASVITRLRREHDGTVPLTARYDPHEHLTGPPLPHLFQHRHGPPWAVPNYNTIRTWLDQTIAYSGLIDAEGQPLRYTPHDFRRIFATDAASGGLPVHIIARLLGHKNLNTTQAYMAIFDEELSAPTDHSSTTVVLCAPKPNTASPPNRNGASSTSISSCASSNSVSAAAPTAHRASMSMPASDVRACG